MVAPKRHRVPGSVVLLTSHPVNKQTLSILVRNHLLLNVILPDSLISNPTSCSLMPGWKGPNLLESRAWQSYLLEYGQG